MKIVNPYESLRLSADIEHIAPGDLRKQHDFFYINLWKHDKFLLIDNMPTTIFGYREIGTFAAVGCRKQKQKPLHTAAGPALEEVVAGCFRSFKLRRR